MEIIIRPYRADDLEQIQALDARVTPYRPDDQPAVEAMQARARHAEAAGGERSIPPTPPPPALDQIDDMYLAFWVAVTPLDQGAERVVGMVGIYRAGADLEMPPHLPLAQMWRDRNDRAELRRLRVAPEVRRQGIGERLNLTAIAWARDQGFRAVVLNTTAEQAPALSLYRKLGFREVGRSFVGLYELVWFELAL